MTGDGEGLGEEVGKIFLAGDKEDAELVLFDPVSEPKESHIHALRALRVNGVRGKAVDNTVVLSIVSLKYTVPV